MPVPSSDGCRQPEDVAGFGAAGHQLEAHRREVVTLVHDELAAGARALLEP
jgi:hypothetical protein